ncbi:MAG TPA: hypothetical protein VHU19_06675 [Pyrinomonadaceae bacterium]|nr:hypothetical protein [Pyrinomonadaceae bacterium]
MRRPRVDRASSAACAGVPCDLAGQTAQEEEVFPLFGAGGL